LELDAGLLALLELDAGLLALLELGAGLLALLEGVGLVRALAVGRLGPEEPEHRFIYSDIFTEA
jgi:hypothetical protein